MKSLSNIYLLIQDHVVSRKKRSIRPLLQFFLIFQVPSGVGGWGGGVPVPPWDCPD